MIAVDNVLKFLLFVVFLLFSLWSNKHRKVPATPCPQHSLSRGHLVPRVSCSQAKWPCVGMDFCIRRPLRKQFRPSWGFAGGGQRGRQRPPAGRGPQPHQPAAASCITPSVESPELHSLACGASLHVSRAGPWQPLVSPVAAVSGDEAPPDRRSLFLFPAPARLCRLRSLCAQGVRLTKHSGGNVSRPVESACHEAKAGLSLGFSVVQTR